MQTNRYDVKMLNKHSLFSTKISNSNSSFFSHQAFFFQWIRKRRTYRQVSHLLARIQSFVGYICNMLGISEINYYLIRCLLTLLGTAIVKDLNLCVFLLSSPYDVFKV